MEVARHPVYSRASHLSCHRHYMIYNSVASCQPPKKRGVVDLSTIAFLARFRGLAYPYARPFDLWVHFDPFHVNSSLYEGFSHQLRVNHSTSSNTRSGRGGTG